jgi:hypothetical protein
MDQTINVELVFKMTTKKHQDTKSTSNIMHTRHQKSCSTWPKKY